jgi:outer membrane murein-binding lipoprotein Lpp
MEAHPTITIRIPGTPTIVGLQRELHGLKSTVATLTANHAKLAKEVMMLRGAVEVLMVLKEDMLVNVPALTAGMSRLRDEMDLEMMKAAVVAMQHELARVNRIQPKGRRGVPSNTSASDDGSGDDSSSDDSSSDEDRSRAEDPGPLSLAVPKYSGDVTNIRKTTTT